MVGGFLGWGLEVMGVMGGGGRRASRVKSESGGVSGRVGVRASVYEGVGGSVDVRSVRVKCERAWRECGGGRGVRWGWDVLGNVLEVGRAVVFVEGCRVGAALLWAMRRGAEKGRGAG